MSKMRRTEEELSQEETKRLAHYNDPKIWTPEDFGQVTQGTTTRDFLTLRDKVRFNSVKKPMDTSRFVDELRAQSTPNPEEVAARQPDLSRFRCISRKSTFRTIPDKDKYKTEKSCPPYTRYSAKTGCCFLPYRNIWDGREYDESRNFLYALFSTLRKVKNRGVAQKTFGADLMSWYRANKIGASSSKSKVTIYNGSGFRDIFLQFLFRAKPTIGVTLDLDHPMEAAVRDGELNIHEEPPDDDDDDDYFDKLSWVLTSGKQDTQHFVDLMNKTGVEGRVTYTYDQSLVVPAQPIHMKCSTMIHAGHSLSHFMDVTDVHKLFASGDCGFNGEKNIFVKAIGVLSKETSLVDFLIRLMKSMPDIDCKFSMLVDDGSRAQGERQVDLMYHRVLPLRHNFSQQLLPDIDDVMGPILEQVSDALPRRHGTRIPGPIATGGVFGFWTETLYENRKRGTGDYLFILKLHSSDDNDDPIDPTFTLEKKMLVTIGV